MAAKKETGMTARELMQQLESDPVYLARRAEKEARHRQRVEQLREAEAPFLLALAEASFPSLSVDDIRRQYNPLPQQLVLLLIDWIPRIEHPSLQESVAWVLLAVPKRSLDGRLLIPIFDTTKNDQLKWALADVIEQTRPQNIEDWLLVSVRDRRSGSARNLLASAVAKMLPAERAVPVLLEVFGDVPLAAAHSLGKVGDSSVRDFLIVQQPSATGPLRRELRQAIARIERRLAKTRRL